MSQPTQSTDESVRPTVQRADRGEALFNGKPSKELSRLVKASERADVETSRRLADLARRAYQPITRLIEADADAKAAAVELQKARLDLLEKIASPRGLARTFDRHEPPNLLPALHRGVNVFAPPYDFEVEEPERDTTATSERISGTFEVALPWGREGARTATAGVGLALRAGVTGIAHLRPAWRFEYTAAAYGHWLGSYTKGAGLIVVQDAISGAHLKAPPPWKLWEFTEDHQESNNGYMSSWSLGLDFLVQAGQMFTVTVLGTATVDDSGTGFPGWSLACAYLNMSLPLVVVELGP